MSAYLFAFLATLLGVLMDVLFDRPWTRADTEFGEYDLGISTERWTHWGNSAQIVLFASFIAGIVEAMAKGKKGSDVAILLVLCIITYAAFWVCSNLCMQDGHMKAVREVLDCEHVKEARRQLFESYALHKSIPARVSDAEVRGRRNDLRDAVSEILKRKGRQTLIDHSETLFLAAIGSWIVLGTYLFWDVFSK